MKKLFSILFIIFSSLFFGHFVFASDVVDLDQSVVSNYLYLSDSWQYGGQNYTPGHNNISAIYFYQPASPPANATTSIAICKGVEHFTSLADLAANGLTCNTTGSTFVYSQMNMASSTTKGFFKFTNPIPVNVGESYYFVFHPSYENNLVGSYRASGGSGGLFRIDPPTSSTLSYKVYYSDTYTPPPTYQLNLIHPTLNEIFYSQPASYVFSYENPIDFYEVIKFRVKRKAGGTFGSGYAHEWTDYVLSSVYITNSVASTTLTTASSTFQIPDGVYDLRVDFERWNKFLNWYGIATSTFSVNTGGDYGGYTFGTSSDNTLFVLPTITEENLCSGIATTTTFGAIECGFKKALVGVISWAFVPSFDTLQNFKISYELWKGCFPFNTYFQLTDTITNAASSTASSTSGTIKIPFINTGGDYYMLDAISSSTLSNWIGATNYNLFRTTIGYFFWLIAGAIVFFTIKFI